MIELPRVDHISSEGWDHGMPRKLQVNNKFQKVSVEILQNHHTPAMNKPKATPSSPQLPIPSWVSAGLQRLPGLSRFEKPSMNTTAMIVRVDTMPSMEVYERSESGKNTVGINLNLMNKKINLGPG